MGANILGSLFGGSIPPYLGIAMAMFLVIFLRKDHEVVFHFNFFWLGKLLFQSWTVSLFEISLSVPQLLGVVIVFYCFLKTAFCTERENGLLPQGPDKITSEIDLGCSEKDIFEETVVYSDDKTQGLLPPKLGKIADEVLSLKRSIEISSGYYIHDYDLPETKVLSVKKLEVGPLEEQETLSKIPLGIVLEDPLGLSDETLNIFNKLVSQTVNKLFKYEKG